MNSVFADTSFYIALLSPEDAFQDAAQETSDRFDGQFVTTEYVLVELGNYFCSGRRDLFLKVYELIESDPDIWVVPASTELFKQGLELYSSRGDKDWSLTDCISFVVMKQRGISDALTSDHHFEQVGFRALLREDVK